MRSNGDSSSTVPSASWVVRSSAGRVENVVGSSMAAASTDMSETDVKIEVSRSSGRTTMSSTPATRGDGSSSLTSNDAKRVSDSTEDSEPDDVIVGSVPTARTLLDSGSANA